jgi:antitoxin component of MazEF toxin-antitoxin module
MGDTKGLQGRVRRVGHSIAIFVPPKDARRARLRPGTEVSIDVHGPPEEPALGFLKRRGISHRELADPQAEREMWPDES